jgi:hypothetical protein
MLAFGVPVPGTTSAVVAPKARAAMKADVTPRTTELRIARTATTNAREN